MTSNPPIIFSDETLRRALIDTIGRFDSDRLKALLFFIASEIVGYPMPEESQIGNSDEHLAKQLIRRLTEDESLSVLHWILNTLSPQPQEPKESSLMSVQKFIKYDLSSHLKFLGVKQAESIPQDLDENLKQIKDCLNIYRNALADLNQATYSAISTLDLIAEAESVLQGGNWSVSKGRVSSVFALRLAVECRDRLRRSHQEFKEKQANSYLKSFDKSDVDDIPF